MRKGCYSDPVAIDRMYKPYATSHNQKLTMRIKKSDSVKNETIHQKGNRLVQEISQMGEDLLDCRIKLFVYKENHKVDIRFGRVDSISLGMPIEEMLLNNVARSVLSAAPFPLLLGRQQLEPIAKDHEHYEPNGFDYYKTVRLAEQQQMLKRMRGEQPPTEAAVSARQGALRKTNISKARESNLLNTPAIDPTSRDEIDLMLACVQEAREEKSGKGSVWFRAEKLFYAAFCNNATLPETERKYIRGPTTAAKIETTFKGYAVAQKAFLTARESEAMLHAPPELDVGETPTTAAALTLTSISSGGPGPDTSIATGNALSDKTSKSCATARWKRKIEEGVPLLASGIDSLPLVAARQYLRAMNVTVSRAVNNDIVELRRLLREQIGTKDSWCKCQKT